MNDYSNDEDSRVIYLSCPLNDFDSGEVLEYVLIAIILGRSDFKTDEDWDEFCLKTSERRTFRLTEELKHLALAQYKGNQLALRILNGEVSLQEYERLEEESISETEKVQIH